MHVRQGPYYRFGLPHIHYHRVVVTQNGSTRIAVQQLRQHPAFQFGELYLPNRRLCRETGVDDATRIHGT
ncbi:MAG: hypothetical protein H8E44_25225 [Planctomycetes bacterium]|nr:hypothetical protein [Planctomycetota bacterium]